MRGLRGEIVGIGTALQARGSGHKEDEKHFHPRDVHPRGENENPVGSDEACLVAKCVWLCLAAFGCP